MGEEERAYTSCSLLVSSELPDRSVSCEHPISKASSLGNGSSFPKQQVNPVFSFPALAEPAPLISAPFDRHALLRSLAYSPWDPSSELRDGSAN